MYIVLQIHSKLARIYTNLVPTSQATTQGNLNKHGETFYDKHSIPLVPFLEQDETRRLAHRRHSLQGTNQHTNLPHASVSLFRLLSLSCDLNKQM